MAAQEAEQSLENVEAGHHCTSTCIFRFAALVGGLSGLLSLCTNMGSAHDLYHTMLSHHA